MKKSLRIIIFLFLFFLSGVACAQEKNILKGRIFAMPLNGIIWSLGIGYERVLPHNFSIQLMLNNKGSDSRMYDGPLDSYDNIIPEVKYYFSPLERITSSFFISSFLEIQRRKYQSSGESDDVKIHGNHLSPGFLLGKNIRLSHKMHFEMYLGIKYRFGSEQKEEIKDNFSIITDKKIEEVGVRSGLNLAYRF